MTIVHLAPNATSAASIRAALDAVGDSGSEVVAGRDDLSCGPIDHIDQGDRRAWWIAAFTGDMGRRQLHLWDLADKDTQRLVGIDADARMIVWVGRRSPEEYASYLFLAEHFRLRQLHVIDVTAPRHDGETGVIGKAAALPPIRIGDYLGSERALDDNERSELAQQWSMLRTENAPFRVVSAATQLVSAPIDHFDSALLTRISSEPKPMTKVIAETMADHPFQVGDYVLQQRLIALIDAGVVSAEGDPMTARMCLIRRMSQ
ncbi:DUF3658 domain-containing protein [Nocardia sp. NPDC051463]|uniref:DUF3658 domain-containing protein n=1 Tax=Nocardia sp. NPDC051463 TaxID=3154845 RepID=UPI00344E19DF